MVRVVLLLMAAAASSAPPAAADGVGELYACARLDEPLLTTAEVCTSAIRSGDLTELQVGEALLYRGIVAYMLGEYEGALSDLSLSIQYAPEAAVAYYYKGLAYEALGQEDRADGQYRSAFAYGPSHPKILAKMRERGISG